MMIQPEWTPDFWLRRAIVRAFERIPVADRGWNEKVADAIMNDERFRADLGPVSGLYDALDELWGNISNPLDLTPETRQISQEVHTLLWHSDEDGQ